MLLELNNINNNAVEQAVCLVSTRTSTNVFLYLALDARSARICLVITLAI
jgi:hypothetical protein